MAILKSCLSNIFWSGFRKADATARVRDGMCITNDGLSLVPELRPRRMIYRICHSTIE
jgi:hypothetical protein